MEPPSPDDYKRDTPAQIAKLNAAITKYLRSIAKEQWPSDDVMFKPGAKAKPVTFSSGWLQAWVWVDRSRKDKPMKLNLVHSMIEQVETIHAKCDAVWRIQKIALLAMVPVAVVFAIAWSPRAGMVAALACSAIILAFTLRVALILRKSGRYMRAIQHELKQS